MLGCCRFSITRQAAPTAPGVNHAAILAMETPVETRTAEQQAEIAALRKQIHRRH